LNRTFSRSLWRKIDEKRLLEKTASRVYRACMKDFKFRVVPKFANNGQEWVFGGDIKAPFPETELETGYITFTNNEILQCFEPVVNRVLELIRKQVEEVHALNGTLKVSNY
jgi:hypothetical protein